ncbi:MAG TPA: flagellar hook-length control protein FliK [Chloroflexota bacterium]|nr:flagellar hook-length control protein FliK [Chloroflexota bacterium]
MDAPAAVAPPCTAIPTNDVNAAAISSLLTAQQAVTTAELRAFVLEVGQELTATILGMMDDSLVSLEAGGHEFTATLQTDQQLVPGQTVQLVATDVQPSQITLRLVPPSDQPASPTGQQALAAVGLPDDALNRAALVALVAEGLPASADAIQALRQEAAALGATTPEDMQAIAYLMARDLPASSAFVSVVRNGQAASQNLEQLQADLRSQAAALLAVMDGTPDSETGDLRGLLEQVLSAASPSADGSNPAAIQSLVQQLTVTVEALLAQELAATADAAEQSGAAAGTQEGAEKALSSEASGLPLEGSSSAADLSQAAGAQPEGTLISSAAEAQALSGEGSSLPLGSTVEAAPGQVLDAASEVATRQAADLTSEPASAQAADPAQAAAAQAANPASEAAAAQAANPASEAAAARAADAMPERATAAAGQGEQVAGNAHAASQTEHGPAAGQAAAGQGGSQVSSGEATRAAAPAPAGSQPPQAAGTRILLEPLPAGSPMSAHEAARRLLPALDGLTQDGGAPPALATAAANLRQTAEHLVHAVQFQQLDALLQPTPAEPYFALPLPIPPQHGQGELWLYVRDGGEGGGPKIDPDDVRLAIELRLSQLKRVSIMVHACRGQLTCHMEADTLAVQRLLEAAAPELQEGLRELGYAVDPIRCTVVGTSQRSAHSEVSLPVFKLGSLNVRA